MAKQRPDIQAIGAEVFRKPETQESAAHPLARIRNDEQQGRVLLIPLVNLEANADQPRKHFDEKAHKELTDSIREMGVLEAIIAYQKPGTDQYVIIAGERRFRAAQAAGLTEIPATIRKPEEALEIAIIENLQREDLSPLEEAEGLLNLKLLKGYTDQEIAKKIGKSRVTVSEMLALNDLPEGIKEEVRTSGALTKSQLLEVLRSGSTDGERLATWEALITGQAKTVRALRSRSRPTGKRRFQRAYIAPGGHFRVTVSFEKPDPSPTELSEALMEALNHLI